MRGGPEDALTLASTYVQAGNYRRAEEVLRSALLHNPQDATLLTVMSRVQYLLGDHAAAERSALGALSVAPDEVDPMRVYAVALCMQGRTREGLSWARRAVEAAPLDPFTHYEYAALLLNAGEPKNALSVAAESLRLDPTDPDTHNLMGMVLYALGRLPASTAAYQEALRLEPGHAWASHNIAVNQVKRRKFFSALAGFRKAAQLDPGIGDRVRHNIAETMLGWLRRTSIMAWVLLWICVLLERIVGADNPAPRIIAGCGTGVLLALLGWLAAGLPPRVWRSVLGRQGRFRALRIFSVLGAFVIGALGAFALGVPISEWVIVIALLISLVTSRAVSLFDKGSPTVWLRD